MKKYIIISILLFLVSCGANYECIEGDDFGFPKASILATGNDVFATNAELNYPQCSNWLNTRLALNGKRLFIVVTTDKRSRWEPWFGSDGTEFASSQQTQKLCTYTCAPPSICPPHELPNIYFELAGDIRSEKNSFYDIDKCYSYHNLIDPGCSIFSATNKSREAGGPVEMGGYMNDTTNACSLNKGDGLYGLVAPSGTKVYNNRNVACNDFPTIKQAELSKNYYTFHLGGYMNGAMDPVFDGSRIDCNNANNTCYTSGYNSRLPDKLIETSSGDLYFKIQDSYYTDNSGQYNIIIKSGASYSDAGPIGKFIAGVLKYFNDAGKNIFENVVKKIGPTINAALIVYVIFAGIGFLFGMWPFNFKTLIIHLFKMSILIQLTISQTSWDFFNGYLIEIFTKGVDQICCIVANGGACDARSNPAENLIFFDNFLREFFSFETQMKIWSLPISDNIAGFFSAIMIQGGTFHFVFMLLNTAVCYVLGYIGIILLICLFPLLMPFMLFSMTKQVFDNWLKAMISFSLEIIMIIGFLALTSQMMMHQFHSLLGFKVCYQDFNFMDIPVFKVKGWVPIGYDYYLDPNDSKSYALMPVPEYIQNRKGEIISDKNGNVCEPYACECYRVPILPFLQPADAHLATLHEDHKDTPCYNLGYDNQERINYILHSGRYSDIKGAFIFVCMVVLMRLFAQSVPSIAKIIASGNSQSYFNTSDVKRQMQGMFMRADENLSARFSGYKTARDSISTIINPVGAVMERVTKKFTDPDAYFKSRIEREKTNIYWEKKADVLKKYLYIHGDAGKGAIAAAEMAAIPGALTKQVLDKATPGLLADIKNPLYQGQLEAQFSTNPAPLNQAMNAVGYLENSLFGSLARYAPGITRYAPGINAKFQRTFGADIGQTIGLVNNIKSMYWEDLKSKMSFGLAGQDMRAHSVDEDGKEQPSQLEIMSRNLAYNYGVGSEEGVKAVERSLSAVPTQALGVSFLTSTTISVVLAAPVLVAAADFAAAKAKAKADQEALEAEKSKREEEGGDAGPKSTKR